METRAPQRLAATAWFAPLPPNPRWKSFPKMVSPGRGKRSVKVVRSILALPTTAIWGCFINPPCVDMSVDAATRHPLCHLAEPGFERCTKRLVLDGIEVDPDVL